MPLSGGRDGQEYVGHNLPLLLLFHIIMNQCNLAFVHSEADTRALARYMTITFVTTKIEEAANIMADAFHVPHGSLDLTAGVKVRPSLVSRVGSVSAVCGVWGGLSYRVTELTQHILTYPRAAAMFVVGGYMTLDFAASFHRPAAIPRPRSGEQAHFEPAM